MLHAKFQYHWHISSVVLTIIIWAWRPSWSCDLDHLNKLSFSIPKEAPHEIWIGQAVSEEKMFQNDVHIHVYIALGEGQTAPPPPPPPPWDKFIS